jgi:hypothetical protein
MLVDDHSALLLTDPLRALASALDRQALSHLFGRLAAREQLVIKMAYLDGRANREIAAALGVSISTVRRNLRSALSKLEAGRQSAGRWISAALVLPFVYALIRGVKAYRVITPHPSALIMGAGTVTAAAVTLAVIAPAALAPVHDPGQASKPPSVISGPVFNSAPERGSLPPTADAKGGPPEAMPITKSAAVPETRPTARRPLGEASAGCHGNPTSAPPAVPVASRSAHPTQAPVTHPTAGGCRT